MAPLYSMWSGEAITVERLMGEEPAPEERLADAEKRLEEMLARDGRK